jgi:hypothetical protein
MAFVCIEERKIVASAGAVYDALADFERYPQWNPWVTSVVGEPVVGSELRATARTGDSYRTVHHRMLRAARPCDFAWCDIGWFTVFARGERIRNIQDMGDGHCHYRCELRVDGPLVVLVDWLYGKGMRAGMAAEADALKRYCELRGQ